MLIIFTSPKGGTGKSTLTLLYANYLFQVFKKKVCILDVDKNHALSRKAKRHPYFGRDGRSFPVMASRMEDIVEARKELKEQTFDVVLVDLDYALTNRYLQTLQLADLLVCPYRTDELTLEATLAFAMLLSLKKINAVTLFVPNRIKQQAEKELIRDIESILSGHGEIAPSILDTAVFEQLDFFCNSKSIKKYASAALSFIKQHSV